MPQIENQLWELWAPAHSILFLSYSLAKSASSYFQNSLRFLFKDFLAPTKGNRNDESQFLEEVSKSCVHLCSFSTAVKPGHHGEMDAA